MKRKGKCKRCGDCCDGKVVLGSFAPHLPIHLRVALKVALLFKKDMKCPFLSMENGITGYMQYRDRFDFCKDFPAAPNDMVSPSCGFRFEGEEK